MENGWKWHICSWFTSPQSASTPWNFELYFLLLYLVRYFGFVPNPEIFCQERCPLGREYGATTWIEDCCEGGPWRVTHPLPSAIVVTGAAWAVLHHRVFLLVSNRWMAVPTGNVTEGKSSGQMGHVPKLHYISGMVWRRWRERLCVYVH